MQSQKAVTHSLPSLYSISIESQPVATAFSRKSISMPLLPPGHITREQRGHPLMGAWTKALRNQKKKTINDYVAERQFYGE